MKKLPSWLLRAVGHDPRRARELAEASRDADRRALQAAADADEIRFRARMDAIERTSHIVLGTTATGASYRISVDDLVTLPMWLSGGTGSGKSRFCGAFVEQVFHRIVHGEQIGFIGLDAKGESADLWLRTLGTIAGRLHGSERRRFLARLTVLRFFDETYLPSWPILARGEGVEITTQAEVIAEVLTDGVADTTVGPRQRSTLAAILALAIEFAVPLTALPWLLSAPSDVAALAARSGLPSVRLDLSRFERERQESIDGLVARLSTILRASLKSILSGEEPFDFARCFEPGSITILDFGGAPLGALAGVRAMGSLAVSGLANAAFDPRRSIRSKTLLLVDEPQVIATSVSLGAFERLVTLGRSFGAGGLAFVHQGATQLPQSFQATLSTNVAIRALGRSAEADVAAAGEWLPITRAVPRPLRPGANHTDQTRFLSESEERRFRIAEIGRLPPRHFLVADRRLDSQARVICAPEYAPPSWDKLDPTVADAVRRGVNGVSRSLLEARVKRIEEEASARFEEALRNEPARGPRRRGGSHATPDVVGRDDYAGRGGVR